MYHCNPLHTQRSKFSFLFQGISRFVSFWQLLSIPCLIIKMRKDSCSIYYYAQHTRGGVAQISQPTLSGSMDKFSAIHLDIKFWCIFKDENFFLPLFFSIEIKSRKYAQMLKSHKILCSSIDCMNTMKVN